MNDWSLVFRDCTDHGVKRLKATPDPVVLESNLDQFECRWGDAKYNDIPVLNEAALKELSNIRKHIKVFLVLVQVEAQIETKAFIRI